MRRYLLVQPYGRHPREATIVDSFDALEDAFEALDWMAERLHSQGVDPDSFGFRMTDPPSSNGRSRSHFQGLSGAFETARA
jgi:hypothetical protein